MKPSVGKKVSTAVVIPQSSLCEPAIYCLCVCVRCAGFCAMPGPHRDSCLLVFGTVGEPRVSVGAWDGHRHVSLIIAHCKQTAVNLRRVHDNNNQAEVPEIRKDQTSFTLTQLTCHNTLTITHY